MEIAIIAIVLLAWLVLGGIVSFLVCPLLKLEDDKDVTPPPSAENEPREVTAPHASSHSYH